MWAECILMSAMRPIESSPILRLEIAVPVRYILCKRSSLTICDAQQLTTIALISLVPTRT